MPITLNGSTGITLPDSGNIFNTSVIRSDTGNPPTIQNTSGIQIGTFCRAWVNFNGTGTVAIRAAFNVSTITDFGAGRYQLNFTNALSSNLYMTLGTSGRLADDTAALSFWERASNKTTTHVELNSTYSTAGNNGYADYESMNAAVFI